MRMCMTSEDFGSGLCAARRLAEEEIETGEDEGSAGLEELNHPMTRAARLRLPHVNLA